MPPPLLLVVPCCYEEKIIFSTRLPLLSFLHAYPFSFPPAESVSIADRLICEEGSLKLEYNRWTIIIVFPLNYRQQGYLAIYLKSILAGSTFLPLPSSRQRQHSTITPRTNR